MKIKLHGGDYAVLGYCGGIILNAALPTTLHNAIGISIIVLIILTAFKLIDRVLKND